MAFPISIDDIRRLAFSSLLAFVFIAGAGAAEKDMANIKSLQQLAEKHAQLSGVARPVNDGKSKGEWGDLFLVCSRLFELRSYSHVSGCRDIAEKWNAGAGDEKLISGLFGDNIPHDGYPAYPGILHFAARASLETGDYGKAIELAKKALASYQAAAERLPMMCRKLIFNCGMPNGFNRFDIVMESNLVLASAYFLQGNQSEAEKYRAVVEEMANESWPLNKQLKARRLAAKIRLFLTVGTREDAVKLLDEDSFLTENLFYFAIGAFHLASGNWFNIVDQTLWAAIQVARSGHNLLSKFQLAHLRLLAMKTDEAKKELDELLSDPVIETHRGIYWAALHDRGRIAEMEGQGEAAEKFYYRAVEEIERQRSSINSEGARIGFFGDKQAVYQDLVRLLAAGGKAEAAFLVTERSKARALVDMLAGKADFQVASGHGERVRQLLRQQSSVDDVFSATDGASALAKELAARATTDGAKLDIGKLNSQVRGLEKETATELSRLSPELASLVSVGQVSLAEIRQGLPPDETIVSYFYDKERLYAFLVDGKDVRAVELDRAGLEAEVEAFRDALQQEGADAGAKARSLYRRLISPLAKQVGTKKIILAPHGVLHYLPFGALSDGSKDLIDQYQLSFLPSASTIKFVGKTAVADKAGSVLVFGNPDLGDRKYDLAAAENEARAIGSLFPKSAVLLRKEASKRNFAEYAAGFTYLHFATHGKFNPGNPLGSALMLAGNSAKDDRDRLTVGELYSTRLNADLVTLSACETGLGAIANGDDVVGLVRGFLYAGSNHVVSTLWEIDDEATEKLMVVFYQGIKAGIPKAEALRTAQIALRKSYPAPRYWAAFQITGGGARP